MLIRPVAPDDFDAWRPLWDGYNAFYGRSGKTALSEPITQATWRRLLSPSEAMHGFVAESEGGLIGLAHSLYHDSTTSIAPVCYMQDLFTAEAARGRGVATALIAAVAQKAKADGVSRLYWHTHETNAKARKVYDKVAERSGFIVYRKILPA